MKKDLLPALRKELESSFGRKILSSRDCLQMVDDIYHKTGYTVNANTLRRFFGLVKTNYSASPSTLTILSKYCGFNSIDEIEHITHSKNEEINISKEEVLHYLISLFKNLPVSEGHNTTVESVIHQTVLFLERNPSLTDRFHREIAKTPAGQHYYFELAVNMDQLGTYYGDGLLHYMRAKNTEEARIFANSMLVFRYWLSDERAKMDKHMALISDIAVSNTCPSHVFGRLIAARILSAAVHKEPIDKILGEATKYHVSLVAGSRDIAIPSFPDFELAVCEALVLTHQEEEGAEYIRRGKSLLGFVKNGLQSNPFSLWENIINSRKDKTRKFDMTRKNQSVLHSYNYYLNKRYNNLVLLTLNKQSQRQKGQLENLIKETGFTRFKHLRALARKKVLQK